MAVSQQVKDVVPWLAADSLAWNSVLGTPVKARSGFYWSDAEILVHLKLSELNYKVTQLLWAPARFV